MSFTSSLAAFGMKPATTSTTNLAPAFGQPAAGTGTSTTGNTFGGFGGGSTTGTGAGTSGFGAFGGGGQSGAGSGTTGLFGGGGTNTFGQPSGQQQTQGTSLFGQPSGATQAQPTGSLFGQPATQPTPSLFSQPAGGTQPATTSLFGQPAPSTTQNQTNFGSSLFGGGTAGTGTAQSNAFGNFGQSTNQTQPNSFSSFGQSTAQQPSTFGGFGSSTLGMSSLGGGTGGGLFGQQQQQQQQSFPSTNPQFTKTTKFNDLPDELKRVFENIESHIQGRVQISKELKERKVGEEAMKRHDETNAIYKDIINTTNILRSDVAFTRDLRSKVEQATQDVGTSMRIIDAFKSSTSPQNHAAATATLKNFADFPQEYFMRVTMELHARLQWYRATVEQIERKLNSLASHAQNTPQSITSTISAQNATFLSLAAKTAQLDAELQKIKEIYTQLWRQHTGSMKDPFSELDRSTIDPMNVSSILGR